jgi:hypothetical protein
MGWARSMYGGQQKCIQAFRWENMRGRDHLEDLGVDGRTILIWIFRYFYVRAWTGLMWLRIVSTVMNLRVP